MALTDYCDFYHTVRFCLPPKTALGKHSLYSNIFAERTQEIDPRSEWRALQEEMLRSYLASAEHDLKAKQELIDVKHQRLHIAQDEYQQLNNTLSTLSASNTSCKLLIFFFQIKLMYYKIKVREFH